MKIIVVAVAVLVGAGLHGLLTNESQSARAAREIREAAEDKAWRQMEETYYERCRSRWSEKTGCFRVPNMKAEQCFQMLEKKCGSPEAPKKE